MKLLYFRCTGNKRSLSNTFLHFQNIEGVLFCFKKTYQFELSMVSEAEPNQTGENMQLNTGLLCDAIAKPKKQWHSENSHCSYLEFIRINNLQ